MKTIFKLVIPALLLAVMAFTIPKPKLTVTSSAFTDGGMIPTKYTCQGAGVSPPLTVTDIPTGAKSLSIIVHDRDAPMAGGVTHWVVWDLTTKGIIRENFKGVVQGQNSDKQTGYKPMCPPDGPAHHYNFKVYALDTVLELNGSTDNAALQIAMQGHIVAEGLLTGLYGKK